MTCVDGLFFFSFIAFHFSSQFLLPVQKVFHSLTQSVALLLGTKGLGEVQSCEGSLSNTLSRSAEDSLLPACGGFYLGWQQHVESQGLVQRQGAV